MKIVTFLLLVICAGLFLVQIPSPIIAQSMSVLDFECKQSQKLFQQHIISQDHQQAPAILNCKAMDLNSDGSDELIVCDQNRNAVLIYEYKNQIWSGRVLSDEVQAPCSTHFADLDGDGDLDCAVASLGDLFPNDGQMGAVYVFELSAGAYIKHKVASLLRRVTDVQSADLDNDGDIDLVVAEFGHAHGQILWLENVGLFTYKQHYIYKASGAIHVPLADFDNDGDIDIVANISQNDEEVLLFENDGKAQFSRKQIFKSINYDLGSSGLFVCDLDGDQDQDLLLTCGDNLEASFHFPQQYHGCYWLENIGNLQFKPRKLQQFPGCYGAAAADFDADGDLDIALVSMVNNWANPKASSLIWLENDGKQNFLAQSIANDPIQLVSCCAGKFDGKQVSIIAGSLHLFPPYERMARLAQWTLATPETEIKAP